MANNKVYAVRQTKATLARANRFKHAAEEPPRESEECTEPSLQEKKPKILGQHLPGIKSKPEEKVASRFLQMTAHPSSSCNKQFNTENSVEETVQSQTKKGKPPMFPVRQTRVTLAMANRFKASLEEPQNASKKPEKKPRAEEEKASKILGQELPTIARSMRLSANRNLLSTEKSAAKLEVKRSKTPVVVRQNKLALARANRFNTHAEGEVAEKMPQPGSENSQSSEDDQVITVSPRLSKSRTYTIEGRQLPEGADPDSDSEADNLAIYLQKRRKQKRDAGLDKDGEGESSNASDDNRNCPKKSNEICIDFLTYNGKAYLLSPESRDEHNCPKETDKMFYDFSSSADNEKQLINIFENNDDQSSNSNP
ncbi:hypothetical protein KR074_005582 [Drosophila pseudoananassae]|nr:hypothetical protein KR074_005582 [Drosophila pseudoananassae]